MITNYLITALRNIYRHRSFTFVNILGLSVSMSVCMLIIVILHDQMSYDSFHTKKSRIYRVESTPKGDILSSDKYATTALPLAQYLRDNYDFTDDIVALSRGSLGKVSYNKTKLSLHSFYANESFFQVFDFELQSGNPETALTEPNSIVLTDKIAHSFFGEENPVGKYINSEKIGELKVTGIVKTGRQKSHIQFEALISLSTLPLVEKLKDGKSDFDNWQQTTRSYVYLLLKEGVALEDVQQALDRTEAEVYTNPEEVSAEFSLKNLSKIAPGPMVNNEIGAVLPIEMIYFLAALALLILLSAAFNYAGLSIARMLLRAKEVGIRKTIGASRQQIILQFVLEATLMALFAMVVAVFLLQILLPGFLQLQFISVFKVAPQENAVVYLWFLVFAIITGLLSGILPALFISKVRPVVILRGFGNMRLSKRLTLRKILLVTQFVFSTVLIISIVLLARQANYMITSDMGFDREEVYNLELQGQSFEKVRNEFAQIPEIEEISAATHAPGIDWMYWTEVLLPDSVEPLFTAYYNVDNNYLNVMGIRLVAGKSFDEIVNLNTGRQIIINKTAVKNFGFKTADKAIGKIVLVDSLQTEVIGVIEDYKHGSMFSEIAPLILQNKANYKIACLRLKPADFKQIKPKIEAAWKQISPDSKLEGEFLNDRINEYYAMFTDFLYIIGLTAFLAILISSIGLLGMAAYSTQTRIKEISIRKIHGAKISDVVWIMLKSYLVMLLIAIVIALPIAYFANNIWLQEIAFHVDFGFSSLLFGVVIILFISLITIWGVTMKAARTNPTATLKYE